VAGSVRERTLRGAGLMAGAIRGILASAAVNHQKPVFAYIETTDIGSAGTTPTAAQIKSEVWMTLIPGARLVAYFSHVFAADGSYLRGHDSPRADSRPAIAASTPFIIRARCSASRRGAPTCP